MSYCCRKPGRYHDEPLTDSDGDSNDEIDVFWETKSLLPDTGYIPPPPPPPPIQPQASTSKTSIENKQKEEDEMKTRKKRKRNEQQSGGGEPVDASTLRMVSQLAMRLNTRSNNMSRNSSSSSVGIGTAKHAGSAPPRSRQALLRDKRAVVNTVNSRKVDNDKGRQTARATTAPIPVKFLESSNRPNDNPIRLVNSDGKSKGTENTFVPPDPPINKTSNPKQTTTNLATSQTTSDDFDDLFGADDSFEHLLSQYDEESLISNATTLISSGSITLGQKNIVKSSTVGSTVIALRGPGKSSGEAGNKKAGSSPRRTTRSTAISAAPVDGTDSGLSNNVVQSKQSIRPPPLVRASSTCSQAEAEDRLKSELESLAKQDCAFWSEEGDEI